MASELSFSGIEEGTLSHHHQPPIGRVGNSLLTFKSELRGQSSSPGGVLGGNSEAPEQKVRAKRCSGKGTARSYLQEAGCHGNSGTKRRGREAYNSPIHSDHWQDSVQQCVCPSHGKTVKKISHYCGCCSY